MGQVSGAHVWRAWAYPAAFASKQPPKPPIDPITPERLVALHMGLIASTRALPARRQGVVRQGVVGTVRVTSVRLFIWGTERVQLWNERHTMPLY